MNKACICAHWKHGRYSRRRIEEKQSGCKEEEEEEGRKQRRKTFFDIILDQSIVQTYTDIFTSQQLTINETEFSYNSLIVTTVKLTLTVWKLVLT